MVRVRSHAALGEEQVMRKEQREGWGKLHTISTLRIDRASAFLAFFSSAKSPHLSTTSFRSRDHFDASLIRAKICAGEAFNSLFMYIRDLSEPPAFWEFARIPAAS